MKMDFLLSLAECARLLNTTPQRVKFYINTNRFPLHARMMNGRKRWRQSEVLGWEPEHKTSTRCYARAA